MKRNRLEYVWTGISLILVFIPWTLFILRQNEWALQSPVGELLIGGYAVEMSLGGVYSIAGYVKKGVKNKLMQVCTMINGLYAAGGGAALVMMWV